MMITSEVREMGFIKIINPAIRDELSKAGFNYITENIGKGKKCYAFADCKELKRILWRTDRILKLKRQTFDKANDRILCIVPSGLKSRYDRILARAVQEKNFRIQGRTI